MRWSNMLKKPQCQSGEWHFEKTHHQSKEWNGRKKWSLVSLKIPQCLGSGVTCWQNTQKISAVEWYIWGKKTQYFMGVDGHVEKAQYFVGVEWHIEKISIHLGSHMLGHDNSNTFLSMVYGKGKSNFHNIWPEKANPWYYKIGGPLQETEPITLCL